MASEWTDELKEQVIEAYQALNPTPENTSECVKEVAEEFGKTPNGTRIILQKAGVYVKKEPAKSSGTGGGKRTSKAEAIANLSEIISSFGLEVDEDILGRLTGKAANYFSEILKSFQSED